MKTRKTTSNDYKVMINLRDHINYLCGMIDAKDIENLPIIKQVDHITLVKLFVYLPCKTDISKKTAKQLRRMIDTWFKHNQLAKFQIEAVYSGNEWHQSPVFNDDLDFAKRLHDIYADWSKDIRIRNNYTQELIYRQGSNWVTFAR